MAYISPLDEALAKYEECRTWLTKNPWADYLSRHEIKRDMHRWARLYCDMVLAERSEES
jgi:hypothetical protein